PGRVAARERAFLPALEDRARLQARLPRPTRTDLLHPPSDAANQVASRGLVADHFAYCSPPFQKLLCLCASEFVIHKALLRCIDTDARHLADLFVEIFRLRKRMQSDATVKAFRDAEFDGALKQ